MVQNWEAVAWSTDVVKDQLRYGKLKGLIKKSLPIGIRQTKINLKQTHSKRITITMLPSNTKFINPYTFLGIMVGTRDSNTNQTRTPNNSPITDTELSGSASATLSVHCSYNERHPDFHMAKV